MAREQINQMIMERVLEQLMLVIHQSLHEIVILSHQVATKNFFVRRFFVQFLPRNNIRHIKKYLERSKFDPLDLFQHSSENDVIIS